MGVHESQSLFWECRVARGRAFAERWHPRFAAGLGADPWGGAQGFWRALNPLRPGLIRVEADELSYALHIVLRFELELALLEQDLPVEELPEQWNQRMGELLGLVPPTDREGCLQDIHWAEGLFGYFPSYALGHLISAQLSEAMAAEIGPIEERVAAGDEAALRAWLARQVWPLGRSVNGEELVEQVSGGAPQRPAVLGLSALQGGCPQRGRLKVSWPSVPTDRGSEVGSLRCRRSDDRHGEHRPRPQPHDAQPAACAAGLRR